MTRSVGSGVWLGVRLEVAESLIMAEALDDGLTIALVEVVLTNEWV